MSIVFISGPGGRCGTTLTRNLLDGHSRLHVLPGEASGVVRRFAETTGGAATRRPQDLTIEDFDVLLALVAEDADGPMIRDTLLALVDGAPRQHPEGVGLDDILRMFERAVFGDAADTLVVDTTSDPISVILAVMPEAKVLAPVRHPVNQLNSVYRHRFANATNLFHYREAGPLGSSLTNIRRQLREAAAFADDERVFVYRLEDLQRDVRAVIEELFRFLGKAVEPINLAPTRRGAPQDSGSTHAQGHAVFVQEDDHSCLTRNDLYWAGKLQDTGGRYDVPRFPWAANAFLPFLWRSFGFVGVRRRRLRPWHLPRAIGPTIEHFRRDRAMKRAFEAELSPTDDASGERRAA